MAPPSSMKMQLRAVPRGSAAPCARTSSGQTSPSTHVPASADAAPSAGRRGGSAAGRSVVVPLVPMSSGPKTQALKTNPKTMIHQELGAVEQRPQQVFGAARRSASTAASAARPRARRPTACAPSSPGYSSSTISPSVRLRRHQFGDAALADACTRSLTTRGPHHQQRLQRRGPVAGLRRGPAVALEEALHQRVDGHRLRRRRPMSCGVASCFTRRIVSPPSENCIGTPVTTGTASITSGPVSTRAKWRG